MFGSDWPVANVRGGYSKVWHETNLALARLSPDEWDTDPRRHGHRILWPADHRSVAVIRRLASFVCRGPGDVYQDRYWSNQINRTATTQPGFVIERPAARDDDVVVLAPCAESLALGLGIKAVMLQDITKRNAADLSASCEIFIF